MLISSKGQYALRLMVDISINSGSTVTVKAVARRCGLSDKYLEQVTSSLLKAGYLRSVRGPRGGYRLNMPAEEITVGMVLRAIEGRISPIDNRVDEDGDTNMVMNDVIGEVWDDLRSKSSFCLWLETRQYPIVMRFLGFTFITWLSCSSE